LNAGSTPKVLYSESEIRARVAEIATAIARLEDAVDLAIPILVGGFVFAADLLRDLDRSGRSLPVEFLRLRSYALGRTAEAELAVLQVPGEVVARRHVLLIDGVLDHGRTLKRARELVFEAGARAATTAVVVDKFRKDALLKADFSAFRAVDSFIVGYGMDDAGRYRSLPYIAAVA
jgi:hypoxanthine phosphoribosyltransferase